jgi:hypothetical protein
MRVKRLGAPLTQAFDFFIKSKLDGLATGNVLCYGNANKIARRLERLAY